VFMRVAGESQVRLKRIPPPKAPDLMSVVLVPAHLKQVFEALREPMAPPPRSI